MPEAQQPVTPPAVPKVLESEPGYVRVIDPQGLPGSLPADLVQNAIQKLGFRLPSLPEAQHLALQQEYGQNPMQTALAGVESAGSGATFGLSRMAENVLGLTTPEAQAARKEFNPLASGLGEATGIGASLLFAPEASLPGMLGKTAAKIGGGAAEVLGSVGGTALGSALEASAYGLGKSMDEAALGDPTLNAQKVFNNIGMSALFGGALGGGIAALGAGVRGAGGILLRKFGRTVESPGAAAEAEAPLAGEAVPTGEPLGTPTGEVGTPTEGAAIPPEAQTISENVPRATIETPPESKIPPQPPITQADEVLAKKLTLNPEEPKTAEDVAYFRANKDRIEAAPRLGTDVDPAKGEESLEDVFRRSYEANNDQIQEVGEKAKDMLANSNIVKPTDELQGLVEKHMDALQGLKVKGEETRRAIDRLQDFLDQLSPEYDKEGALIREAPADFTGGEVKDLVQELDADLQGFYSRKLGQKVTTKTERVLLDLRQDLSDTLKKDLKEAGFPEYTDYMAELRQRLQARENFERYFSANNSYSQRILKSLERNEFGIQSRKPLTTRGIKESQSWMKAIDDLGELTGTNFRQLYKDRAVRGRLFPEDSSFAERGSYMAQLLKGVLKGATSPVRTAEQAKDALIDKAINVVTGEKGEPTIFQKMSARSAAEEITGGKGLPPSRLSGLASKITEAMSAKVGAAGGQMGSFRKLLVPLATQTWLDHQPNLSAAEHKAETLIALERAKNSADTKIQRTVGSLFNGESSQAPDFHKNLLSTLKEKTPEEHGKELEGITQDVNELVNNPQLMLRRLQQNSDGLEDAAPNTAVGLNMTATRALHFLAAKLPQPPDQKALDPKFVPSKDQLVSLAKTMQAINNPYKILDELKIGNISRETKDVMANVYPELYDHLKMKVSQAIADRTSRGDTIPFAQRLPLAHFLDTELDRAMSAGAIQRNQIALAGAGPPSSQPQPMQPRGRGASAKHLTLSNRLKTPLQRVIDRE